MFIGLCDIFTWHFLATLFTVPVSHSRSKPNQYNPVRIPIPIGNPWVGGWLEVSKVQERGKTHFPLSLTHSWLQVAVIVAPSSPKHVYWVHTTTTPKESSTRSVASSRYWVIPKPADTRRHFFFWFSVYYGDSVRVSIWGGISMPLPIKEEREGQACVFLLECIIYFIGFDYLPFRANHSNSIQMYATFKANCWQLSKRRCYSYTFEGNCTVSGRALWRDGGETRATTLAPTQYTQIARVFPSYFSLCVHFCELSQRSGLNWKRD